MEISKQTHEETLKETKKQAEERKQEFDRQMEIERKKFLWEKRMEFLKKNLKILVEIYQSISITFNLIDVEKFFTLFIKDFQQNLGLRKHFEFLALIMTEKIDIQQFKKQFNEFIYQNIFPDDLLNTITKTELDKLDNVNLKKKYVDYCLHIKKVGSEDDHKSQFDANIRGILGKYFAEDVFFDSSNEKIHIFISQYNKTQLDDFINEEDIDLLSITKKDELLTIRDEFKKFVEECENFFTCIHSLSIHYLDIYSNNDEQLKQKLEEMKKGVEIGLKYYGKESQYKEQKERYSKNHPFTKHCNGFMVNNTEIKSLHDRFKKYMIEELKLQ